MLGSARQEGNMTKNILYSSIDALGRLTSSGHNMKDTTTQRAKHAPRKLVKIIKAEKMTVETTMSHVV
jgi:hypothetical protein